MVLDHVSIFLLMCYFFQLFFNFFMLHAYGMGLAVLKINLILKSAKWTLASIGNLFTCSSMIWFTKVLEETSYGLKPSIYQDKIINVRSLNIRYVIMYPKKIILDAILVITRGLILVFNYETHNVVIKINKKI
jgi:hypothetical protein